MAKVTIANVAGYDGEYDLDFDKFKNRDLRTIKKISGVLPTGFGDALAASDPELVVALAVIAVQAVGKGANVLPHNLAELFFESDAGAIKVDLSDDQPEVDERPPDSQTPSGEANSHDAASDASESTTPSGLPGKAETESLADGVKSEPIPLVTGARGSEPISDFAQPI